MGTSTTTVESEPAVCPVCGNEDRIFRRRGGDNTLVCRDCSKHTT